MTRLQSRATGICFLAAALILGISLLFTAAWAPFAPAWLWKGVVFVLAVANLVGGILAIRKEW